MSRLYSLAGSKAAKKHSFAFIARKKISLHRRKEINSTSVFLAEGRSRGKVLFTQENHLHYAACRFCGGKCRSGRGSVSRMAMGQGSEDGSSHERRPGCLVRVPDFSKLEGRQKNRRRSDVLLNLIYLLFLSLGHNHQCQLPVFCRWEQEVLG